MVDENSIVSRRYTYVRECNCPVEAIDIHHVLVKRSKAKRFFIYLSVFVGLSNSLFLVLSKVRNCRYFSIPFCLDVSNFIYWSTFLWIWAACSVCFLLQWIGGIFIVLWISFIDQHSCESELLVVLVFYWSEFGESS